MPVSANKFKGILFYLIFVVFCLAVSLILVEGLLRAGWIKPAYDMVGNQIVFDNELLYRVKPSSKPGINPQGYRDSPFQKDKADKQRILFLGDSFIMGDNVAPDETIPQVLEKLLSPAYDVMNMGIVGYGPDQSLLQLKKDGLKYQPDMVILSIYCANDYNDLIKNRLININSDGTLRLSHQNAVAEALSKWQIVNLWHYLLYKFGFSEGPKELFTLLFGDGYDHTFLTDPQSQVSRIKMALMRTILHDLKRTLAGQNIELFVLILPSYDNMQNDRMFKALNLGPEKYFMLENITAKIAESEGIAHLNIFPKLMERRGSQIIYQEGDEHLNAAGTAMVAEILREELIERNLIRKP